MEKFCVLDYYSNVEYQGLCATINLSKIKDLEKQEESHTIGLLSIQIDKYETKKREEDGSRLCCYQSIVDVAVASQTNFFFIF